MSDKRRDPVVLGGGVGERWALETRRATVRLARMLAPRLSRGSLLLLTGDLGVGKTFFVRALCRALGVPASVRVTSPSFALVNELDEGRVPIIHADLYRLASADEVFHLGLAERRDDALMLVEWGERFLDVLGGDALELTLSIEGERRIAELVRRP